MESFEVIETINAKESAEGFEALNDDERLVWIVSGIQFEMDLGGASGYLYNSAGDHLPDVPAYFVRIGCRKLAKIADRLNTALAARCDVRDREARYNAMTPLTSRIEKAMTAFEDAITDREDDLDEKLDAFIATVWP